MVDLRALPLASLLLLSWLAVPGAAQATGEHHCGALQLVFLNPDLQPQKDGLIHAQGQFFAQFQAIGADADKIKVFGFSFSPVGQETDETSCSAPVWVTGAYIQNYRADYDPTDGFFIPVVTPLVPDGMYNAAVHAYDASNNELARFWALAVIKNCDDTTQPPKCDTDAAQLQRHDKTGPWMMVLPGDGKALDGHFLTLEFGEAISHYDISLDGKNITSEMSEWPGRLWDADYTPDYAPYAGQLPHCQAPNPVQNCMKYGPAYEWKTRALTDDDVVRVQAWDLAGNYALKEIHVGSGVTGGAISADIPALEDTVDHQQVPASPGKSAVFGFDIQNRGAGTGHPFADAKVPAGWTFEWQPVHVVVPPGESKHQELVVDVPAGAAHGIYSVNATLTYEAGGQQKVMAQQLSVLVGSGGADAGAQGTGSGSTTAAKKSVEAGPLVGILLLGLVAARRRR